MTLRNFLLFAGLSVFLFGCVVIPRPFHSRAYDDDYYDYQGNPSYQGYFYAQIIFIDTIPYYVGDDRIVRPIPQRYREHFRRYDYDRLNRPPVFSRDREVRDGYPVSRIVYLNGVPYHVGDKRRAQALPDNLRDHFRYTPSREGNFNRNDNRLERFDRGQDIRQIEPSGNTRERERMDERMDDRRDRRMFENERQNGANRDAPAVDMHRMQQQERTTPQRIERKVREQPRTTARERKKENNRVKSERKNSREKTDESRDKEDRR